MQQPLNMFVNKIKNRLATHKYNQMKSQTVETQFHLCSFKILYFYERKFLVRVFSLARFKLKCGSEQYSPVVFITTYTSRICITNTTTTAIRFRIQPHKPYACMLVFVRRSLSVPLSI